MNKSHGSLNTVAKKRHEGQFKPGQSGNPGGRPKGLETLVREKTKNGVTIVEKMVEIASGELKLDGKRPRHSDCVEANKWLAERGYGKVRDVLEVDGSENLSLLVAVALAKKSNE